MSREQSVTRCFMLCMPFGSLMPRSPRTQMQEQTAGTRCGMLRLLMESDNIVVGENMPSQSAGTVKCVAGASQETRAKMRSRRRHSN